MTFDEFNQLQLKLFDDALKIALTKGREYASSEDRLANFKRLAAELELTPAKVGFVYFKKHLDSIMTYLKDGKEHSEESIRGRFLDAINYLTLIYGCLEDQRTLHEVKNAAPDLGENHESVTSSLRKFNVVCERCGRQFVYHEHIHFNSNGDLVHDECPESTTSFYQTQELRPDQCATQSYKPKNVRVYKGGHTLLCKYCNHSIQIGQEYNQDPSGVNHWHLKDCWKNK